MITVKVTNCTIVESDMIVSCQTTNTDYPDITLEFSTKHGCGQTLEGAQNEIDGGAKLLWIAYAKPQWTVA
jgi:hypothetical protein